MRHWQGTFFCSVSKSLFDNNTEEKEEKYQKLVITLSESIIL